MSKYKADPLPNVSQCKWYFPAVPPGYGWVVRTSQLGFGWLCLSLADVRFLPLPQWSWSPGGAAHEFTRLSSFQVPSCSAWYCHWHSESLRCPVMGWLIVMGKNAVFYLVRGVLKATFSVIQSFTDFLEKELPPSTYNPLALGLGIGGYWAGMETGDMSEPSPPNSTPSSPLRLCVLPGGTSATGKWLPRVFPRHEPHLPK